MTTTPYASYDGTTPYGWPAPPAEPAPDPRPPRGPRRRHASAALALALMLGSGATGAGLVLALDDAPTATTRVQQVTGAAAAPAAAGTTEAAAATIGPSVVTVRVSGTQTTQTPFGAQQQRVSGNGSGVVLDADGHIVTNNHVVEAAAGGGSVSVLFSDGSAAPAEIVGLDPTSDLAVLKVAPRAGLKPAEFADSDALRVGQSVLAVGAPLGLSNTVTEGIVSTLNRPVRTGEGASEQSVIDAIQTDAAINPGNSGGALVDLAGAVVGLNTAIATASGSSGSIGVGFAIPSETVVEVAEELIADGTADHPQLGVALGSTTDLSGALVQQVSGPAQEAGLQPGDVITEVDGRAVTDADSLIVAVRAHEPGDVVAVTFTRDGQTRTAEATLVAAPTE